MTDQPPVQPPKPPNQPPNQPAQQPGQGSPPTQPMSAVQSGPAPTPPDAPKRNLWRRATSTRRGVWAVGLGAGALATLMVLGIGLAGLAVLRNHDRVSLVGNRQDGFFRRNDGQGNGRGPGADDRFRRRAPARPGIPDGQGRGPGGLGGLLNGTALHGEVTASANGSVQALVFQRGEVTAVSATSITLKSSDGFTGTYGLTPETRSTRAAAKGGQAFVLARVSDKVAIRTIATRARVGVAAPTPSS